MITCWLLAANDKYLIYNRCGGCIQVLHQLINGLPGDLNSYYRNFVDAYPLLVAFAVINGGGYVLISVIGFLHHLTYLLLGILNYTVFTVLFAIIYTMVQSDYPCYYYQLINNNNNGNKTLSAGSDTFSAWNTAQCNTTSMWYTKHRYDSYDFFWAGALICFLLGAYQISCAAALVYCDEFFPEVVKKEPEKLEPEKKNELPFEKRPVDIAALLPPKPEEPKPQPAAEKKEEPKKEESKIEKPSIIPFAVLPPDKKEEKKPAEKQQEVKKVANLEF